MNATNKTTPRRSWKDLDPQELRRLYVDHRLSPAEIGILYGYGKQTILNALGYHQIPIRRGPRPRLSDSDTCELMRLFIDDGRTKASLAREFGVSANTIDRYIKRHQSSSRSQHGGRETSGRGAPAYRKPLSLAEKRKIIELYECSVNGRPPTREAIAREVGRSPAAVGRVLYGAGIEYGRKPHVTAEEKARIIELYQTRSGTRWTSTTEIAGIVGRARATVGRILADAGIIRSVSEGRRAHVTETLRRQIIRLYLTTHRSYPAVAEHLGVGRNVAYQVLDEAEVIVRRGPNSQARVGLAEAEWIENLYKSGLTINAVAQNTGRTEHVVRTVLHASGVVRTREENDQLAAQRRQARTRLATTMDLRRLARRWDNGTTLETLAAEHCVPIDLLWEALSKILSWTLPGIETQHRADCAGTCPYACTAMCARVVARGTNRRSRS